MMRAGSGSRRTARVSLTEGTGRGVAPQLHQTDSGGIDRVPPAVRMGSGYPIGQHRFPANSARRRARGEVSRIRLLDCFEVASPGIANGDQVSAGTPGEFFTFGRGDYDVGDQARVSAVAVGPAGGRMGSGREVGGWGQAVNRLCAYVQAANPRQQGRE